MNSPTSTADGVRLLVATALLLCFAFGAGCQIWPKTYTQSSKSDWEHSNLYNRASPYAKLLVEIDAVEGYGPTREEVRALEAFLREHCDKPGGITIKIDDVIPKRVAVGRTAESLAVEYLDSSRDGESAVFYILFYDGRLRWKNAPTENPSFSHFPHPVVYIDRSYRILGNPYGRTFSRAVLLHEAGHALGLCATANHHGSEGHCTTEHCMMNASIKFDIRRFFTLRNPWTNKALCQECVGDLSRYKTWAGSSRLDFWHGYFRRQEEGYQVFGLPGLLYVRFGDPLAEPNDELLKMRQTAIPGMARGEYIFWGMAERFDSWQHLEALARFTREPNGTLRDMGRGIFEDIVAQIETAAGEDLDDPLAFLTDEFIATAGGFPEQQAKLVALREEFCAPPGYGANLTKSANRRAEN